jgi:DNA invertase Pin-like site-specific DNA recombinase
MTGKFVSYLRVSTSKQGVSGLGLEAQRAAVSAYLNGGRWELVEEFLEVESGKRKDRPQLAEALRVCRQKKATLVIAKLDRLARNVAFVSALMESGVKFIACDMPEANKLTIHILASVAEAEAEAISARTVAALAAAKERGTKLGGRRVSASKWTLIGAQAREQRSKLAAEFAAAVLPTIKEIQSKGKWNLRSLAAELNNRRVDAPRGGEWSATQVWRILGTAKAS